MFTNEDLLFYSDEYMNYEEPAYLSGDDKDISSVDKKNDTVQYGTDGSKSPQEVHPVTLAGKLCDVVDFSSNQMKYVVHNPDHEISGTIIKQTVTVNIKSTWQQPLPVESFYIVAFLEDGTTQTEPLQPAPGDSLTSWIQPDSEYTGYALFEGDLPIVSVECHVSN
jgi:hypothetical protein